MWPINGLNLFALEEEERIEDIRLENIERRLMREESDPFSIEDRRFKELFRVNKDMAQYILNSIMPQMNQFNNPVAIPPIIRFFSVLSFYATGTYQRVIGRSHDLSLAQQSVSRATEEVTMAIVNTLSEQWVSFPANDRGKNEIKAKFMEERNFPGVIGAIDCTHLEIIRPTTEEHNYFNRKGYHSKNIQIICDQDLRILNMNGRFGGATHDSYIWRQSVVRAELEACYQRGDRNSWLLGDSGYPQEPWLMIPLGNALPGSPEQRYNLAHIQARNCVERTIGVLKGRFRCLGKILHYRPQKVGCIANACSILHNICVASRVNEDFDIPLPEDDGEIYNGQGDVNGDGNMARRVIIQRYFNN